MPKSKNKNAIALGSFDGLHLGHMAVLNSALEIRNMSPCAATFHVPPRQSGRQLLSLLMPAEDKLLVLKRMGFKDIFSLDFEEIKDLSPKDFFEILLEKYDAGAVCCGFNYHFGKNAEGNHETLRNLCEENDVLCVVCPEKKVDGDIVSSSAIRHLVGTGDMPCAGKLLGRPFSFFSEVIGGDQRGRTLGFPTINQYYPTDMVEPKYGVYACFAVVDGKEMPAICNIGIRPTFRVDNTYCETYIFDYSGDLYDKMIEIKLIKFLREEKKFAQVEQLVEAIKNDVEVAKEYINAR
ncbi:MAG: riboflavin biosynthesis protein RibF [Oscillospiraceae bacterium]